MYNKVLIEWVAIRYHWTLDSSHLQVFGMTYIWTHPNTAQTRSIQWQWMNTYPLRKIVTDKSRTHTLHPHPGLGMRLIKEKGSGFYVEGGGAGGGARKLGINFPLLPK